VRSTLALLFYFDMGGFHVVGASPEILVRLESGMVTLRPIAGTRPRGASREQDAALERELLADPKERAEHVMLRTSGATMSAGWRRSAAYA